MLKNDFAKCSEDFEEVNRTLNGTNHPENVTWEEVCTVEIERLKKAHFDVVNKTNVWMLSLADWGISSNSKNVSGSRNRTQYNITSG
jgi:hypothetical protein